MRYVPRWKYWDLGRLNLPITLSSGQTVTPEYIKWYYIYTDFVDTRPSQGRGHNLILVGDFSVTALLCMLL